MNLSEHTTPQPFNSSLCHESLFPSAIITFVIEESIGIVSNLFIILCHCLATELRNVHIFAQAVTDLLVSINIVIVNTIPNVKCISQVRCLHLYGILLSGTAASSAMTLLLGIDRSVAISMPLWYDTTARKVVLQWIGCVVSLVVYPGIFIIMALQNADPDKIIIHCLPPMGLNSSAFDFWKTSVMILNMAVIAVYTFLVVKMRKNSTNQVQEKNKQIIRSLIIIAVVHIATWTLSMAIMVVGTWGDDQSDIRLLEVTIWSGIPAAATYATNGFVYFFRSQQYRDVIVKLFKRGKVAVGGEPPMVPARNF